MRVRRGLSRAGVAALVVAGVWASSSGVAGEVPQAVIVAAVAPWGGVTIFDAEAGIRSIPPRRIVASRPGPERADAGAGIPPGAVAVDLDHTEGEVIAAAVVYGSKAEPDTTWIGRFGRDGSLRGSISVVFEPAGFAGGIAIDTTREVIFLTNALNGYVYSMPLDFAAARAAIAQLPRPGLDRYPATPLRPIGFIKGAERLGPIAVDRIRSTLFVGDLLYGAVFAVPLQATGDLGYDFDVVVSELGEIGGMTFDDVDRRLYVLDQGDSLLWGIEINAGEAGEPVLIAEFFDYWELTAPSLSTDPERLVWAIDAEQNVAVSAAADGAISDPIKLDDAEATVWPTGWAPTYAQNYEQALAAVEQSEWTAVARHMRAAIRVDPRREAGADFATPPYMLLATARVNRRDCGGAERALRIAAERNELESMGGGAAARALLENCRQKPD